MVQCSPRFPRSWANSEQTLGVMDTRPHLFHNLLLPSRFSVLINIRKMTWRILNNEIKKKVMSQVDKCHNEGAYIESFLYRHWQWVCSHAADFSVGRHGCVCQVVGNVAHGYYNYKNAVKECVVVVLYQLRNCGPLGLIEACSKSNLMSFVSCQVPGLAY